MLWGRVVAEPESQQRGIVSERLVGGGVLGEGCHCLFQEDEAPGNNVQLMRQCS